MQKSKTLRWSLNGSAAALALVGALAPAQAYETKFGDVSIVFDTTVSMGGSIRTADRNTDLVAPSNGGPVDLRDGDPGSVALPAITGLTVVGATALCGVACGSPTGNFTTTNNPYAYGGSINSDDARLNYNSGDFIGAPLKATSDMVVKWENYTSSCAASPTTTLS